MLVVNKHSNSFQMNDTTIKINMKVSLRPPESEKLGLSEAFKASRIYSSICERDPERLLKFIKFGDNINLTCEKTGNTYLHIVMVEASPIGETKSVPFVYQFSNADVQFDVLNKNGDSPLHLSIKGHLLELMIALIKCGATCEPEADEELIASCSGPVECEFRSAYRKFAPGYWLPVQNDAAFKVNVLVKSWCRINVARKTKSLIEFAKEKNAQDKIIKQLLNNEVSIEFAHATIAGDAERMKHLLLHYKVDMETKDYTHKENYFEPYCPLTLFGAAIKYGHKHILHLIKTQGTVTIKNMADTQSNCDKHGTEVPFGSSSVCNIL